MANPFLDLIKNKDNAELAEEGNAAFGLGVNPNTGVGIKPTSIPLELGLTNAELAKESAVPVPQPEVPFRSYNDMVQAEPETDEALAQAALAAKNAPAVGNSRSPSGSSTGCPSPKEDKPEDASSRLERLMSELKGNRTRDLEDARSRQLKANMIQGVVGNLGLLVGGAQAMNTKASVTAPAVKGMEVGDLEGKVNAQYKPELDDLMSQYKTLQKTNQPMTEYQRRMLDHMGNQLKQSKLNSDRGMERYYGTDGRLRSKQSFVEREKFEDQASSSLKDLRQTDTWKTSEKSLADIPTLRVLLDDAYKNGGQSLAMIGPKVAKSIAGEVGVLTEADVTRYVKNPQALQGIMDTIAKVKSGKLSESSYDNLNRLLEISEQSSKDKLATAIDREAILFSRRQGIPFEDAKYFLDNQYNNKGRIGEGNKDYQIRETNKPQKALSKDDTNNDKIESFMKKNNLQDKDEAIKILKQAGKL